MGETDNKNQDIQKQSNLIESPTDINIGRCKQILCGPLVWHNYDLTPRKMIITNTGETVMITAAWKEDRPFIEQGLLLEEYDFINYISTGENAVCMGVNIQQMAYPMEMHISHFKRSYLFPNIAKENDDGISIITYLLKLQFWQNPEFEYLTWCLKHIKKAKTTYRMNPFPLSNILKYFTDDFFTYKRSIVKSILPISIIWIISRQTIGISETQVNKFRALLNALNIPISQYKNETMTLPVENLCHLNPSKILFTTLYPSF